MTPDHNPIIGEHPEAPGFFLANGFSGHGLMMAPATGKAVAEIVMTGTSRTIDIGVFAYDRYRLGALLDDEKRRCSRLLSTPNLQLPKQPDCLLGSWKLVVGRYQFSRSAFTRS